MKTLGAILIGLLCVAPAEASFKFRASGTDTIILNTAAFPTTGTICWAWKASDFTQTIPVFGVSDGINLFDSLIYQPTGFAYAGYYNGTDGRVITSSLPTNGAWNHSCITFSPTATLLYLNNAQIGTTNTSNGVWNTTGFTKYIGYVPARGISAGVDNYIAEVGVWKSVLDSTTLGYLMSSGYAASCFSGNEDGYWPLSADATDYYGADNGTASGAAFNADHPTVTAGCPGGGGGGGGAITLKAHSKLGYTADSTTLTSGSIDTSGANFYAILLCSSAAMAGHPPTDSDSHSFTQLTETGTVATSWWYVANVSGHAGYTFTINSASSTVLGAMFLAFSGVKTSSPFDQQNSGTGTSTTTATTGSVTPGQDNELILDGIGDDFQTSFTHSIGSGQTLTDQYAYVEAGFNKGCAAAYEIQTTATTRNPTWTVSGTQNNLRTVIATFKAGAAATGHNRLLLTGVGN